MEGRSEATTQSVDSRHCVPLQYYTLYRSLPGPRQETCGGYRQVSLSRAILPAPSKHPSPSERRTRRQQVCVWPIRCRQAYMPDEYSGGAQGVVVTPCGQLWAASNGREVIPRLSRSTTDRRSTQRSRGKTTQPDDPTVQVC